MKKSIGFVAIILCISIYYCSNDSKLTARYSEFRDKKPYLRFEKYQYGDLFGLSFLSRFRETVSFNPRIRKGVLSKDVNLFILGDSYLHHHIEPNNFSNVNKVYFMRWWYYVSVVRMDSLDLTKRNVLVIEMSERFLREIGASPALAYNLLQIGTISQAKTVRKPQIKVTSSNTVSLVDARLFNAHLSSNLEFNMFDYPLFNKVKEWKADFNYYAFHRVNKDVYVDAEKDQLYFAPTIRKDSTTSSFVPVSEVEIGKIVHHFNEIYSHYKSLGFQEIYLSVIPNPVTCVHPNLMQYNELLPRIYANDSLQPAIIDVYKVFKQDPQQYYYRSDTHWNTNGLQTWIDLLDLKLKTH